jgi:Uma2 family endonuclease
VKSKGKVMAIATPVISNPSIPINKTWTDRELMALPDDGNKYELVDGELVMSNSGLEHGWIAIILASALYNFAATRKLGVILDSSTAFTMKTGNKRSPDISFLSKDRLQGLKKLPKGFGQGAPDLVVEILSPSNTTSEIHSKIVEYFDNGTQLIWVINPEEEYVLVYRYKPENRPTPDRLLTTIDNLSGEEILSDFSFPVANLFPEFDF